MSGDSEDWNSRVEAFYHPARHDPSMHIHVHGTQEYADQLGFWTRSEIIGLGREVCPSPGLRLLDVGCGRGGPARLMATELGASVLAVELCPAIVAEARALTPRQLDVQLVEADILKLDHLEPGSVDAAVAIDSLVHVPDVLLLFRKMRAWLRPGGRFLIATECMFERTPAEEWEARERLGVVNGRTLGSICASAEREGFRVARVEAHPGRRASFAEGALRWMGEHRTVVGRESMNLIRLLDDNGWACEYVILLW
jgi:SAM-dependent methyltransferase